MEKFYFCNFLDKLIERETNSGVVGVTVSAKLNEEIRLANCYLINNGKGNKVLQFLSDSEKTGGEVFDFIGSINAEDRKVKSSYEALKHTDDNPIIVVATKGFKVLEGIPTYIKYMPVKGGVLVGLIKGYIEVESEDGSLIPLSRYVNAPESGKGKFFNASEIGSLNALVDKESDVPYNDYVVSDCIISLDVTKDGRDLASYKFSKTHFSFLDKKVFEEGKTVKEEKERIRQEELKRKREEHARMDAELRRKELEEMAAEEEKVKKAKEARARGEKKKVEKGSKGKTAEAQVGAQGAASFLAYVEGLKKEKA